MAQQPVFAGEISEQQLQGIMQQLGGSQQPVSRPERKPSKPIFVHIGFDTQKLVWFVNLFDYQGQTGGVGGTEVNIDGGCGEQYEWTDPNGLWHIRERMFWEEIRTINTDGSHIEIITKKKVIPEAKVPDKFEFLEYAYHLRGNMSPRGFVDFFAPTDYAHAEVKDGSERIARIDDRWIIVEDVKRRTVGTYPNIRLRIEATDIGKITVTKTCLIIQGKV